MYDYVLQYGFDKDTQKYIESIKSFLKYNNIKDKEKNWLPHITIDLYDCKNEEEFILKVDRIVSNINEFEILCNNLNDFDKKTLYIEPFQKDRLLELKNIFNNELNKYRKENRIKREYRPHITLCTNDNIDDELYELANKKFNPITVKVKYIWIYNQKMELIKEYELLFA